MFHVELGLCFGSAKLSVVQNSRQDGWRTDDYSSRQERVQIIVSLYECERERETEGERGRDREIRNDLQSLIINITHLFPLREIGREGKTEKKREREKDMERENNLSRDTTSSVL